MVFDSGALPHSEEAESAEPPVLKIEPPAEAKAADAPKEDKPVEKQEGGTL
jgi:hypothetical protein